MITHKDTIGSGEVYGKRNLASFHKRLFQRGAKINLPNEEEGVYLERFGTGSAWVLTNGGAGGKKALPMSQLEALNTPVVEEKK